MSEAQADWGAYVDRTLPFLAKFEDALRSGVKTMTCRTKRYGHPGDILNTRVGPIRLTMVDQVRLGNIRASFWEEEGCESPEDFQATWEAIHPRKPFDPLLLIWCHEFELVTP